MRKLLNFCRGGAIASLSILAMLALFAAGCSNSSSAPYIPSGGGTPAPTPVPTPAPTIDLSTVTVDTTVADGFTITGTLAGNYKISIADGATVTLNGVGINNGTSEITGRDISGLTCEGDATIVIADGSENTIKFMREYIGSDGGAGIFVPANNTLTINGNTGILNATGTCAGIGANKTNGGNVVINGGVINASGSGAGIGGTEYVDFGNITITGGTVTARSTSSNSNAGIGSGSGKSCGNISITGGTVTATGRYGGAAIGSGGNSASCGTITIANTVTKVTATKGSSATNSIGKGKDGTCGAVTIGGVEGAITTSPYTYNPKLPTGGIDGLFSVSATKKVFFSKGNLRATTNDNGSSWTWSFAVAQGDAVGMAAANTTIDGNGTVSVNGSVDLFGWVGENSAFTGMAAFGISNSTTEGDYRTAEGAALNDWGTNAISNGGNVANYGWRTLTQVEWNYVLNTRAGADSKKGAATVNSVKGWILLPDAWTLPAGASFTAGCANGYTTNTYTVGQWAVMESAGAVFLPVTGRRVGSSMMDGTWPNEGYYWSATGSSTLSAFDAEFTDSSFTADGRWSRYKAAAVRLVKDSD